MMHTQDVSAENKVAALEALLMVIPALLGYTQHKHDCDWLQPMWHKGPCDCGFTDLIKQLPEDLRKLLVEASEHARATVEEMKKEPAP